MCVVFCHVFDTSIFGDRVFPEYRDRLGCYPRDGQADRALDGGGPFFLVSNGMLILNFDQLNDPDGKALYGYRKWLHFKSDKVWRKVETRSLEALGVREGMKFQIVEWKNKSKREYTQKNFVHIAMVGNDFYEGQADQSFFRTFYIVLNDTTEGITRPETSSDDKVTGIAYSGSEFALKASGAVEPKNVNPTAPSLQKGLEDGVQFYFKNLATKVSPDNIEVTDLSFDDKKLYFLKSKISDKPEKWGEHKLLLKRTDGNFQ